MAFPEPTAHGPLEEVFPDVFLVRGSICGRGMVFPRNMTVVRAGDALTVVNTVRLDDSGQAALDDLGRVTSVVKLGAFHGLDDPYYVDRYNAALWAPPSSRHKGGLRTDRELAAEACPIPGATVFTFAHTAEPEAALVIDAGGGTLLTCDAVTNLVDRAHSEGCEGIITAENGFFRRASIGAFWRNRMRKDAGAPLVQDYVRLLELPFVNLVSAHGPPLLDTAKPDLIETLRYLYKVDIVVEDD